MAHYAHPREFHPSDHSHAHGYVRPSVDLPRPLEPRPALQTSLSDSAGLQRRPDAFRSPGLADNRSHYQNLPALKDIFTEAPISTPPPPHPSWQTQRRPHSYYQDNDGHYTSYEQLHPPMVLHPPYTNGGGYQSQVSRTFEGPVLETSRMPKHPPLAMPPSPYASYPDSARDFPVSHHENGPQATTGAYAANGVHSPYGPLSSEDKNYAISSSNMDGSMSSPFRPAGPESSKQYLGTRDIPGEGIFHVYEGGYRIPTQVDGEQVNPAWGLTKANKPRKRLALACLDCREKKIKCEPGASSCLQCEKAKRPCRRAPAQTSQTGPGTPTPPWPDTAPSPPRKAPSTSDPTPTADRIIECDSVNKRRERADPSPPNVPSKKHRSASPVSVGQASITSPPMDAPRAPVVPPATPTAAKGFMAWEDDPYALRPDITLHLIELYFQHINSGVYWLYPRRHFMHWLKTTSPKCQNERMVLYAMLAAASIHASEDLSSFGRDCARIATDAVASQLGKFNVSIAQAKIMLSFYRFSKGTMDIPWDYIGAAIRIVLYLRYNTEEGCQDDSATLDQSRVEFGLSREQLAECKRRTFWSCFLTDRLTGASSCTMKPEDIFVRLPCEEDLYEDGAARSNAPFFPNENMDSTSTLLTPASPLATVSWTALVGGIWGDVVDFIFRIPHRPDQTYRGAYETFYTNVANRLQGWSSRLPPHLQYSDENLARSIQDGYAAAFIMMHTLHHMTQMKLNQCLRHTVMTDVVTRNIREAHAHARKQLEMMGAINAVKDSMGMNGQPDDWRLSVPFTGYATLAAIDIAGAGGPESTLQPTLTLIEGGLLCLRELSTYWSCAKDQLRACETRYYQIQNIVTGGPKSRSGAWLDKNWGLDRPMEQNLEPQDDCIYGLGDSFPTYFAAFTEQEEDARKSQQRALRIVR